MANPASGVNYYTVFICDFATADHIDLANTKVTWTTIMANNAMIAIATKTPGIVGYRGSDDATWATGTNFPDDQGNHKYNAWIEDTTVKAWLL